MSIKTGAPLPAYFFGQGDTGRQALFLFIHCLPCEQARLRYSGPTSRFQSRKGHQKVLGIVQHKSLARCGGLSENIKAQEVLPVKWRGMKPWTVSGRPNEIQWAPYLGRGAPGLFATLYYHRSCTWLGANIPKLCKTSGSAPNDGSPKRVA